MLLPELLSIKPASADDATAVLSLKISPELEFFTGHFPNLPILPGVVQVHWAIYFAQQQFSIAEKFSRLDSVKFHSVILPNALLALTLQWHQEKSSLDFVYANAQKKYSSGRVVFNAEGIKADGI